MKVNVVKQDETILYKFGIKNSELIEVNSNMAQIFPSLYPNMYENAFKSGEKKVYEASKNSLSETFVVFYSDMVSPHQSFGPDAPEEILAFSEDLQNGTPFRRSWKLSKAGPEFPTHYNIFTLLKMYGNNYR